MNEAIKKNAKIIKKIRLIPVFPSSGRFKSLALKKDKIKRAIIMMTIEIILVTVILVGVFINVLVSIRFYKPCFV